MSFIQKVQYRIVILIFGFYFASATVFAEVSVVDDRNNVITLSTPAKRILSLSPHTTEMLFSAGAGHLIIGRDKFSNYPAEAISIPIVGDLVALDYEAILVAKPDLIIMWSTGNSVRMINKLESFGFTVFASEPRTMADIPGTIKKLSILMGTDASFQKKLTQFNDTFSLLKINNREKRKVKVFYQIWNKPLYTLNGNHFISKIIDLCGGINVFSDLSQLSSTVSIEAVIKNEPEVIFSGQQISNDQVIEQWEKYDFIPAVKRKNVFSIEADLLQRPTLRLQNGAREICAYLEEARGKFTLRPLHDSYFSSQRRYK